MNRLLNHKQTVIYFFFILVSVPFSVSAATVYKWVDRHGKTHFSQTPPTADTQEYDLRFAKSKTKPPTEAQLKKEQEALNKVPGQEEKKEEKNKTPQQKLADIEKARAEQQKIALEKARIRDERIQKCKKAKSNMRNIEQGGRIYDVNESGEREYWDDNKRSQKRAAAQEHIDKFCN